MKIMSRSIEIEAPIESVFAFVADSENDTEWCPRVLWCRQRQGEGPAVGARYEALHSPTFLRKHSRWIEVIELEPPRRIVTTQTDRVGAFTIAYELEETATGTRLTQRDEIEWKMARLFHPIAERIVGLHIPDQLGNLKRLLEARPRGGAVAG